MLKCLEQTFLFLFFFLLAVNNSEMVQINLIVYFDRVIIKVNV